MNIIDNLNSEIENNSYDKEQLYQLYKNYSINIIVSIEKMLYKLFTEKKMEKNLNNDNSEDILFEYIRLYLPTHIKNLYNFEYTNLDSTYISNINKISRSDSKDIINIIENIINNNYPCIVRNELNIENINNYIENITEQLEEIIDYNKLSILNLI